MKKLFIILISSISFLTTITVSAKEMNTDINIIPKPKSLIVNEGTFKLNTSTKIFYKNEARQIAEYLNEIINPSTGFNLNLNEWDNKVEDNSIIISLSNTNND